MASWKKTIKSRNETYSGWAGEAMDGSHFGGEGYSKDVAERKAESIRAAMRNASNTVEVKVYVEQMSNGNYRVANISTYTSDY